MTAVKNRKQATHIKKAFDMGQVITTRGVIARIDEDPNFTKFVLNSLSRFSTGDWGEMCQDDKDLNDQALISGDRLLAAYTYGEDKIYIITEWDRSYTTVMFPEEY